MTKYYHSFKLPCRFISVSYTHFYKFRLILFALTVLFVSSCEEGTTKIGSDLLPKSDFVTIKSIDTLSVWSYTVYDESVRTDNPSISHLGQLYDPYFGTTTAEFVSQLRLGGAWDNSSFFIDSVRLYLRLLDVKGGLGGPYYLKLSEISEQIYTDAEYYSNKKVSSTGYEVTSIELPKLKPDTLNDVEIKIPVGFGEHITANPKKFFYSNTDPDFRSYFKGLHFSITSSDPLLVSLSLAPPSVIGNYYNYFVVFMHDSLWVPREYYFILDAMNRNASFNLFSHDFSTAKEGKKIENINKPLKDTLSYVQYLNGVYSKIIFPGLQTLKKDPSFNNNIAVNKASLTIPAYLDKDLYKASTVPPQLFLRYSTKSGSKYIVPDYNIDPAFFDGTIDTTANLYRFNIAAYVQGYLKDATDNIKPELEIYLPTGLAKNVILKANSSKTPVKFEFIYSKF